jgi:hypothetical protein
MSVEHQSNHEAAAAALRARRVADINFMAQQHLAWSHFRVPVDKGNLRQTLRQTKIATDNDLEAEVVAGGMEVNGVVVDYQTHVNFGTHHELPNGTVYDIPANPFWTEGEEVARDAMNRRAANQIREDVVNTRVRRTFASFSEDPEDMVGG